MSNLKINIPKSLSKTTLCLTGFSGYVGGTLLKGLVDAGIRPVTIGRQGMVFKGCDGVDTIEKWDDPNELATALDQYDDLVILNLAGHFVSKHAATDITALVSGNLEFPLAVFEALSLSRHSRIVNVGTSWEYSDSGETKPANLYANLKASNASALEWYTEEHGLRSINLKLNDTFGGSDKRAKLMPLLKGRAQTCSSVELFYSDQEINLLHIVDVQEGLLAAAAMTEEFESGQILEAFLLATETITLIELSRKLREGPAKNLEISFLGAMPKDRALRSVWSDAPLLPNWTPRISLLEGLNEYFGEENVI